MQISAALLMFSKLCYLKMFTWYNMEIEKPQIQARPLVQCKKAAWSFDFTWSGRHFDTKFVNIAAKNRLYFYALNIETLDKAIEVDAQPKFLASFMHF